MLSDGLMFIYIIGGDDDYHKVGIARSPQKRLKTLQCGCPFNVRILYQRECDEAKALRIERSAHTILKEHNTAREWFKCSLKVAVHAVEQAISASCESSVISPHPTLAVHPGPWLARNVVEHYGLTVTSAADKLRVGRPAMSNLLNGKAALSSEMALRFEKAFGIPAATMLRMQTDHDLAQAREHEHEIEVERIPELA